MTREKKIEKGTSETKIEPKPEIEVSMAALKMANARLEKELAESRTFARKLVRTQEEEHRTIARELHDEVGQLLTFVGLMIDRAAKQGENRDNYLKEARETINKTMGTVRELCSSLHPAMLDSLGLIPALQWFLIQYSEKTGIKVDFKNSLTMEKIPDDVSLAIFRVIQESLAAMANHSQVKEALVELQLSQGVLYLTISDLGVGFDLTEAGSTTGITSIRERVLDIEGKFSLNTAKSSGTSVIVEIPLPHQT